MKVTDLKENQVVHCKTHEEAKRVLKLAHEAGMKWKDDTSYFKNDKWYGHQEKTCYVFNKGMCGAVDFYEKQGFEIISSEKIIDMKTEFFEERVMEVSDNNTDR